jgi:hypothetical protein
VKNFLYFFPFEKIEDQVKHLKEIDEIEIDADEGKPAPPTRQFTMGYGDIGEVLDVASLDYSNLESFRCILFFCANGMILIEWMDFLKELYQF